MDTTTDTTADSADQRVAYLEAMLVKHNVPSEIISELLPSRPAQQDPEALKLPPVNLRHTALDRVVVCVACGGVCTPTLFLRNSPFDEWEVPALIKAKPGFLEWTRQRWTAKAQHRSDDSLIHLYRVAYFHGGPSGFGVEGIGPVSIDTRDQEMFLPIHVPCYELAKKYCRYQSKHSVDFRDVFGPGCGLPSSIAHLYEIWMKRALAALPEELGPLQCPIPEPSGYSRIALFPSLGVYTEIFDDRLRQLALQQGIEIPAGVTPSLYLPHATLNIPPPVQEHDPMGDPTISVTLLVIQHISMATQDEHVFPYASELRRRLYELPEDMFYKLELAMTPLSKLEEVQILCSRILPASWWKDKLFSGELIPWLFDLDVEQAEGALRQRFGPFMDLTLGLDWELLCRQLSMPYVFELGGILNEARHLMNRYRIWRLFEEARVGQIIPAGSLRYSN
ncbi:hypothetical protein GGR52DRAFT_534292 [Hypoxylon sp. FL1284]|nr:hypothetical protein GGR52DRAFT_534292 [Hypoxylon sp. FL1284]